jgi:hypothetical protein
LSGSGSRVRLGQIPPQSRANKLAEQSSCRCLVRSEIGKGGLNVEKARRLFAAQDRTEAAPGPFLGIANEAGADGIERDVTVDLEGVTLSLDEFRAKAPLEHVTALAPVPISPLPPTAR